MVKFTFAGGGAGALLLGVSLDLEQPIPIQVTQATATGAVSFSINCRLSIKRYLGFWVDFCKHKIAACNEVNFQMKQLKM